MTTPAPEMTTAKAILTLVAFVALIGGCGALTSNSNSSSDTTSSLSSGDSSTRVSCSHFRDITSDISKGILSDTEIRSKMQEVYDSASISSDPGIPGGGQALLSAATAGDSTALALAISAFSTACQNAGV
jgi:hypothetical protein